MTLRDQAERRVTIARQRGREPVRWIASAAAVEALGGGDQLHGLPVERGAPRSEWGLELVCEAERAAA